MRNPYAQYFSVWIHSLLPKTVTLISGPGCPVCVTPAGYIDQAMEQASLNGQVLCTFGDMMRVPGSHGSLLDAKAAGGDVRMMYSPMDVVNWAQRESQKTFIVAAVGFETTLPVYALLVERLLECGVTNVRLLTALKAMMPALNWICENTKGLDGLIGPGHVSTILGSDVYRPLCAQYHIPLAVGGFGYEQIIAAIDDLLLQKTRGISEAHNLYPEAVSPQGNARALALMARYFTTETCSWRGLGEIDASGYVLKEEFMRFDAGSRSVFPKQAEPTRCLCGKVITGSVTPAMCANFSVTCTPATPLGPCMVSNEGACGIWYANRER